MSVESHGLELLRRLGLFAPRAGMWANLGMRVAQAGSGSATVEADLALDQHGGRAGAIHRGAVAALADGATACAAAMLTRDGEIATTVELLVDYFRPARPGRAVARGDALHRSGHLVYCKTSVEQRGRVVAEARATIALVRPT